MYRDGAVSHVYENSQSVAENILFPCHWSLRALPSERTRSHGAGVKFLQQVFIRGVLKRDSKGYSAFSVVSLIGYISHNLALDTDWFKKKKGLMRICSFSVWAGSSLGICRKSRTGATPEAAFRVDRRNIKHAAKRKAHFDRTGPLNKRHRVSCVTEQNQHQNFNVAFGTQTNGKEEPVFWLVVCLPRAFKALHETCRLLPGIKESHQPHSPPVEILTV